MSYKVQFVAWLLVLVVLAGPGAALAACWTPHVTTSGHSCCPSVRVSPAVRMKAAGHKSPCCEITAGKTVPPAARQAPASKVVIAPVGTVAVTAVTVPAFVAHQAGVDAVLLAELAPPQAVLCTFLI